MGPYRVCVLTLNRADYAPLRPLLVELSARPEIEPCVVVSGAHLSPRFGMTVDEVVADGWNIVGRIETLLASDSGVGMSKSFALGVAAFADTLDRIDPAIVVVLGDRYEALAAAVACHLQGIPLAHIGGGQITSGVIDDSIRHALTKVAHLHFTSTEEFRGRIIQLGEAPERVFNVGALGLDNVLRGPSLSKVELEWDLQVRLQAPVLLVTYHPAPHDGVSVGEGIDALLKALQRFADATVIFTEPNPDAGGRAISAAIDEWVKLYAGRAHRFGTLGARVYPSLLAQADAVVGNSSSGLIEAPALGVPTVNVGVRQDGRPRAPSVRDVVEDADAIANAIRTVLSPRFRDAMGHVTSPFGDGRAAGRIAEVLAHSDLRALHPKAFHDLSPTELTSLGR
jgi:UDP-hydrolysing UDP-N-acetyl-D-glucosamine 2-epimerase